jgi:recombination protein RecR
VKHERVRTSASERPGGGVGGGPGRGSPYPEAVNRLIDELAAMPGIGRRSAERLAFHVLIHDDASASRLARAVMDVKQKVRPCVHCFNLTDAPAGGSAPVCKVCEDPRRDRGLVLVVEQPKDLISLEQTGMYRGVYHVLMGRLSPLEGVGPGDLTAGALFERLADPSKNPGGGAVREVILGLNPTVEGDGTGLYLAEELRRRGVRVTRLARGLPAGSALEFASRAVLADAIEGRREVG